MFEEPELDIPANLERFLLDLGRFQILLGVTVSDLLEKFERGTLSVEELRFNARKMHNYVDGYALHAAKMEGSFSFFKSTHRVPLPLCSAMPSTGLRCEVEGPSNGDT